ncbi:hypothetical protein KUL152_14140 [Tenacibaculum sp. KUL152]|nr:hypothetical protein KUL152_14140 [Tenacibaculum sp. KUL152]
MREECQSEMILHIDLNIKRYFCFYITSECAEVRNNLAQVHQNWIAPHYLCEDFIYVKTLVE